MLRSISCRTYVYIHMTPVFVRIRVQHHLCEICVIKCVSIDNKVCCTHQLCLDSSEHRRGVLQVHFIVMYPAAILDYAPEHLHSVL